MASVPFTRAQSESMRRVFAVLACCCLASCSRETPVAASAPEVPSVAVAAASREDLTRDLVLTAEFRPYQEVEVMAKISGYVKQINVDVGDRVRQSQLLATLEVPEMLDDAARASAALQRSDAEVSRARDEITRAESAHSMTHLTYTRLADVAKQRPGLVAQQEIDDAQSKDLVSEANIAAAKSNLNAALQQVSVSKAEQSRTRTMSDYTRVTAPFAGVITKRYADQGSLIQAGTASQTQAMPLVRLSENGRLRLTLPVPESAVPAVKLGESIEVRVPSLKRSFTGRIARFADKVQTATRTMDTEVDVPNPSSLLIPGMYAEVTLTTERKPAALVVPVAAVDNGASVMTVDAAGRLQQRNIKTGMETADRVEILSGLTEGDKVVIGSRAALRSGQSVKARIVSMTEASVAH